MTNKMRFRIKSTSPPRFARQCLAIAVVAFLLLIPEILYAHGIAVFVSTPVSPPIGFRWVFVVFIAALLVVDISLLIKERIALSLILKKVVFYLVCFLFLFLFIGIFATSLDTRPPPGLGPPSRAFYGLGWKAVGYTFIRWNIYGLLFLMLSRFFLCRSLKLTNKKLRMRIYAGGAIVYALAVMPFIAGHALTHGLTGGGYVDMNCRAQMSTLESAVFLYAMENSDRLPLGKTMEEIFEEIKPYIDEYTLRELNTPKDILYCPAERAYERHPQAYKWNSSLSGKSVDELSKIKPPTPVISCPGKHNKIF